MSKKQPKLTPWFPGDVNPARIGVYEKDFGCANDYQYWDGSRWHYGDNTPEKTVKKLTVRSAAFIPSSRPWRGLAVKP